MGVIRKRYSELMGLQAGMKVFVITPEIMQDLEEDILSNETLWKIAFTARELKSNVLNSPYLVKRYYLQRMCIIILGYVNI